MNIITIAGNLGRDGELKQVGDNSVLSFAVASSKKIKGEDKTTWFDCSIWGKRAEALAPYIKKGGLVTVAGEASLEVYQKNDSTSGAKIKVFVSDVKLMGGNQQQAQQPQQYAPQQQPQNAPPANYQPQQGYVPQQGQAPQQPAQNFNDFDDDIPFG